MNFEIENLFHASTIFRFSNTNEMQQKIDLNCDLGEGIGSDAEIMPYISSANIACGFHAGNEQTMLETIRLAKRYEVAIGAHPGYNDKPNFGRIPMNLLPNEVEELVFTQIVKLQKLAEAEGCHVVHVKPHGALYNQAANDLNLAKAIAKAIAKADPQLYFFGLANSLMKEAAEAFQLQFVSEVFADRAYTNTGQLVARSDARAVIHDIETCIQQMLHATLNQTIESIDGKRIPIQADSICIHGDNPEAMALAKTLYSRLLEQQVNIKSPGKP